MALTVAHTSTAPCAQQGIRITGMLPDHVEAVVAIEQQAFPDPWSRTLYFQQLKTDWGLSFVAVQPGPGSELVCGYACGMVVYDECTLHKLACHQDYRQQGIGSALLRHFITRAGARGAVSFFLEVRATNAAARELYGKFGFTQLSVRQRYYSETGEDALILQLRAGSAANHQGA